jgi:hypothetical protein
MSEDKQPLSAFPNGNKTPENMGMTMRDYMATEIIAVMIGSAVGSSFGADNNATNCRYARAAYAVADAMMKVRSE